MPQLPPAASNRTVVSGSFTHRGRHYEQRYVDCGKVNCQRCGGAGARHASHGPYWYLCVPRGRRWTRIYIGKELDTTKYIGPGGSVDWSKLHHRRGRVAPDQDTTADLPGQLDMLAQPPDPVQPDQGVPSTPPQEPTP